MEKFFLKREKRNDGDRIFIGGPVTEEAGLHFIQLYSDAASKCTFNFRDVTNINSNGLRAWMLFLRDFHNEREIHLEECPPVIVAQMNMLPSFTQKAKVLSVYVPYSCDGCNTVTNVLFAERDFPAPGEPLKPGRCKKCMGTTLVDEDDYFGFLDR